MAINLVSLISQYLTPQIVGSLARAAGINEAIAQRLVAAAIPTILGALGTAAAAPGGAQKVADAVSNSDPDLLGKLTGAISGGNVGALTEGASALSALIGGSGLSSIVATLSQFAGAPSGDRPAADRSRGPVRRSGRSASRIRPTGPTRLRSPACSAARRMRSPPLFRPTSPRRWEPRDCSLVSAAPLAESARRRAASALPQAGRAASAGQTASTAASSAAEKQAPRRAARKPRRPARQALSPRRLAASRCGRSS